VPEPALQLEFRSLGGCFKKGGRRRLFDRRSRPGRRLLAAGPERRRGDPHQELAAEDPARVDIADAAESAKPAARYANPALGDIAVSRAGSATVFDFGEWKSEVASRKNPDGTISFLTTAPGISGVEFVVGSEPQKTLVIRDAQHEYVFESR